MDVITEYNGKLKLDKSNAKKLSPVLPTVISAYGFPARFEGRKPAE